MSDWQPIDTAPKDNTAFLVWVPGNRCTFSACRSSDGTLLEFFGGHGYSETLQTATHWMPMPEPPERQS